MDHKRKLLVQALTKLVHAGTKPVYRVIYDEPVGFAIGFKPKSHPNLDFELWTGDMNEEPEEMFRWKSQRELDKWIKENLE